MVPAELQRQANAHNLLLIDNSVFSGTTLGLGEYTVIGGNGIHVGTLIPTRDGRWLAMPGTFPFRVGDTDDVLDVLSTFGMVQTFAVCVTFDRGQMASLERNEDVVLEALKMNARKLVGGNVEGILVGTANWQPRQNARIPG
jgi:hypothetical protein